MVGVAMTDEYGVDLIGGDSPQEAWDSGVAEVQKQPEPVVLDEVSAACVARRRPCPARAENAEPHSGNANGEGRDPGNPEPRPFASGQDFFRAKSLVVVAPFTILTLAVWGWKPSLATISCSGLLRVSSHS